MSFSHIDDLDATADGKLKIINGFDGKGKRRLKLCCI